MRNARAEYRVEPGAKVTATFAAGSAELRREIEAERDALATLARVQGESLEVIGLEDAGDGSGAKGAPADSVRLVVQVRAPLTPSPCL